MKSSSFTAVGGAGCVNMMSRWGVLKSCWQALKASPLSSDWIRSGRSCVAIYCLQWRM